MRAPGIRVVAGIAIAVAVVTLPAHAATLDVNGGVLQSWTINDLPHDPQQPDIDSDECGDRGQYDSVLMGTNKDDTLDARALEGRVILIGLNGDDRLIGGAAGDCLLGGEGKDTLLGGGGDDRLFGGNGKDILVGGAGDDLLNGGNGPDSLDGAEGDDVLDGGAAPDTCTGGGGDDTMKNCETIIPAPHAASSRATETDAPDGESSAAQEDESDAVKDEDTNLAEDPPGTSETPGSSGDASDPTVEDEQEPSEESDTSNPGEAPPDGTSVDTVEFELPDFTDIR